MPFLNRSQIPAPLRAKAEKEHKTRLRQALLNPVLSAEQRSYIRDQLASVGKPKVYSADSPAKQGAIKLVATESASSPVAAGQEPKAPVIHKEAPDA